MRHADECTRLEHGQRAGEYRKRLLRNSVKEINCLQKQKEREKETENGLKKRSHIIQAPWPTFDFPCAVRKGNYPGRRATVLYED
jgi:hypothetical protein